MLVACVLLYCASASAVNTRVQEQALRTRRNTVAPRELLCPPTAVPSACVVVEVTGAAVVGMPLLVCGREAGPDTAAVVLQPLLLLLAAAA